MSLTGIVFLGLWDMTPDVVRVTKLVESLVVRRLEVIVDHTSLFLLS